MLTCHLTLYSNISKFSTLQYRSDARYNERVYTRQRTRLREAANAVTRKRKRVDKRRLTRLHGAENAFPRDSECDHANANAFTRGGNAVAHSRTRTHSHEEANAHAFTQGCERGRTRTHTRSHEDVNAIARKRSFVIPCI